MGRKKYFRCDLHAHTHTHTSYVYRKRSGMRWCLYSVLYLFILFFFWLLQEKNAWSPLKAPFFNFLGLFEFNLSNFRKYTNAHRHTLPHTRARTYAHMGGPLSIPPPPPKQNRHEAGQTPHVSPPFFGFVMGFSFRRSFYFFLFLFGFSSRHVNKYLTVSHCALILDCVSYFA